MKKDITTIKEFYLLPGDELHIHIKNIPEPVKLYLGKSEIDRETFRDVEIMLSNGIKSE